MTDMMVTIRDKLANLPELKGVTIKPYYRPEALAKDKPSLVIVPMTPPKQETFGSDAFLRKQFTYQMTIEARTKAEVTRIACAVEKVLHEMGFTQLSGGLDEYFKETERYVDARRYRGLSRLYDIDY